LSEQSRRENDSNRSGQVLSLDAPWISSQRTQSSPNIEPPSNAFASTLTL
jgi:hypothetical protein